MNRTALAAAILLSFSSLQLAHQQPATAAPRGVGGELRTFSPEDCFQPALHKGGSALLTATGAVTSFADCVPRVGSLMSARFNYLQTEQFAGPMVVEHIQYVSYGGGSPYTHNAGWLMDPKQNRYTPKGAPQIQYLQPYFYITELSLAAQQVTGQPTRFDRETQLSVGVHLPLEWACKAVPLHYRPSYCSSATPDGWAWTAHWGTGDSVNLQTKYAHQTRIASVTAEPTVTEIRDRLYSHDTNRFNAADIATSRHFWLHGPYSGEGHPYFNEEAASGHLVQWGSTGIEEPDPTLCNVYNSGPWPCQSFIEPQLGDTIWNVCTGIAPCSDCSACNQPLEIWRSPENPIMCSGCDTTLFAYPSNCPNRNRTWTVVEGAARVVSPLHLTGDFYNLEISGNDDRGSDGQLFPISILVEEESGQVVTETLRVFLPPDQGNLTCITLPGRTQCRTDAEVDLWKQHPECALAISKHIVNHFAELGLKYLAESDCVRDGMPGNAFVHAYLVCEAARSPFCGPGLALRMWQAHEEYPGNLCLQASMDLANDDAGLRMSRSPGSCADQAWEAIRRGGPPERRVSWLQATPSPNATPPAACVSQTSVLEDGEFDPCYPPESLP